MAGQYTFYGRYVGWDASDNREPLSTMFAARYVNGGAKAEKPKQVFPPGTSFFVWRDTKLSYKSTSPPGTFACDATPAWYPLGIESVKAWDEQEDEEDASSGVSIPAATQRVRVNGPDFPLSYDAGWALLNLNASVAPGGNPPEDATAAQAWVGVEQNIQQNGRYLLGLRAIRLDSARDPRAP